MLLTMKSFVIYWVAVMIAFFLLFIKFVSSIIVPAESGIYVPIVLENTQEYLDVQSQLIVEEVFFIILPILLFCLYSLYHKLKKKGRNTFAKESVNPPFVLYLRSFKADSITNKSSAFTDVRTEEEALVEVLSDIAPVYAIGDPRDKKMPLGASRIYVDDEHWKETVIEMARKAELVVLRLGETDGFWWEVEMVVKNIPLEKILFVVPFAKTFNNVASLYKILLEHNIDIRGLKVNIERKRQGSISSIVYFDNKGNAKTTEIKIGRFTRFTMSYENTLRNALTDFRVRYGFSSRRLLTIRVARICQLFFIVIIFSNLLSFCSRDMRILEQQIPGEFMRECVQNPSFASKYSDEYSEENLNNGIQEARLGRSALSNEEFLFLRVVEFELLSFLSSDELEQIDKAPKNVLLMVKKYYEDDTYSLYVQVLSNAAKVALNNPDEVKDTIRYYQSNVENLSQWVIDLDEVEDIEQRIDIIFSHFEDEGIADILKTMESLTIDLEKLP